jgi:SAM-dependent methyltransferase
VDGCCDCGHVFQNPQLTAEGLDLAYSDAYGDVWEFMFSLCGPAYRNRARAVARFTQPARWLDVGCSLGLFFLVARQVFPETRFEGLDMGDTVEEGYRRGWSDAAHKGVFVDLADRLPTYDVVSLHHYLEHTRDPRAELAAVDEVLEPGGHLMIEVPDPEAPWARRLGRYWPHWGQPQHLHLMPCDNLADELTARGFQVLSVERATAMIPVDVTAALLMWVQSVSRPARAPWLPPPTPVDRLKRLAAITAVTPLVPLAHVVDRVDMVRTLQTGAASNVYRIVARKG